MIHHGRGYVGALRTGDHRHPVKYYGIIGWANGIVIIAGPA